MEKIRTLVFFRNYFHDFFEAQDERVKDKLDDALFTVTILPRIPRSIFEHIQGTKGLYCIRVEFESNIFRIFCCFDEGRIIVLFHGFQKKSSKTPGKEIRKALLLMKEYFNSKQAK